MNTKEQFLCGRQRYQPISLPRNFSEEAMVRDWTLLERDRQEIGNYRKSFRLYLAIQICAVRLYGRFLDQVHDLSLHIVNYLGQQLDLPPCLTVEVPQREATSLEHRQNVLKHLGFQRFGPGAQEELETWLEQRVGLGAFPDELFQQARHRLLDKRILLPGSSVLERLIIHVCSVVHSRLFERVFQQLSPPLRQAVDQLLRVPDGEQRSSFYRLKEYPPTPSISSIQSYLQRYQTVAEMGIDGFESQGLPPPFLDYLFQTGQAIQRQGPQAVHRFQALCADDWLSVGNPQGLAGSSGDDARAVRDGSVPTKQERS